MHSRGSTSCACRSLYAASALLLLLGALATAKPYQPDAASTLYLWPQPASLSATGNKQPLNAGFSFLSTTISPTIQSAFARYTDLIFNVHGAPMGTGGVIQLIVKVASSNDVLQQNVDESYTLTVNADGPAALTANTVYGAIRGLETFSQLVVYDFDANQYMVPEVSISDAPRFSYRGLMIDTARHYQPIRFLRALIDSMSFAKYNVLHWHAVDAQSFPLEIKSFPLLNKGSWNPQARYSQVEMAELVEYARLRGIRVMIEFDGPGHAYSWGVGYPALLPTGWNVSKSCDNQCPPVAGNPCNVPLDPSKNLTYQVLEGVFREVTGGFQGQGIFPEDLMHLGGDEVESGCWELSPEIENFMKVHNYSSYDDVYMYFVQRAHALVLAMGRSPVAWEEVFNHFGTKLDKRTIIHCWLNQATVASATAAGYRAILSVDGQWYLDSLDDTWQHMYVQDPTFNITDPIQQQLVIGGEACMWGETVDPSDMLQTIWPRAAAVAERLWSPASLTDPDVAEPRFRWFRCLLNDRGIPAAPVGQHGRGTPPAPGDCLLQ